MWFIYFSSITNRPIGAKDHASVQLVVAEVNEQGVYEGEHGVNLY